MRERQQMIVVHPDQIVGPQQRGELPGEHRVHAQIARVLLPVEAREIASVVEYRPQRRVREAAIVLIVVAPGEAERRDT
jgi:hypothetical protein